MGVWDYILTSYVLAGAWILIEILFLECVPDGWLFFAWCLSPLTLPISTVICGYQFVFSRLARK